MNLSQFHNELMGAKPDGEQRLLYRANGKSNGYLDASFNRKRLLAVLMLAMWRAKPLDGTTFRKVLLVIPPTHERWALETLSVLARHVLGRMAGRPAIYNLVVKSIQQMQVGSRILGMDEPEVWVSYGFGEDTPMPEWLKARLLRV